MENYRLLEYNNCFSTKEFEEANYYQGNDLGAVWTKQATHFRVWAPTAEKVILNLYRTGHEEDLLQSIPMIKDVFGTWVVTVDKDLNGTYYNYAVTVDGETKEAVDPYAKAAGVNGNRGMVIDLFSTNPAGFLEEQKPAFENATDAVIYELHIRDFSSDQSAGMINKGKYLAFTETATKNSYGDTTGIDYLKNLGITHVHLLPTFDYATVDETKLSQPQFNWGYDPKNYNVPDGSYSTDPYHGEVRIKEFKRMVQALHQSGIRVVMDVVYNHTFEGTESNFNRIVPGYYYRLAPDGSFSNASGCGSETASERVMMRKFILDSVVHWVKEYHIDGFRFDLMGIHDIHTMNEVRRILNEVEPGILVYGEGWTGGLSPLPDWERALKVNIKNMDAGIAVFNDNMRDGIKGSVFSGPERGFIGYREGMEDTIKFGVAAATQHDGIDYWRVLYSNAPWAAEPTQCINYTSAHDNLTLWDKINLTGPWESRDDLIKTNLLAAAIVLTCQGISFFQAGEEFLRSKPLNEEKTMFEGNSYRSPDSINSLKWDTITSNKEVVDYYRGLIAFRKSHSALRMTKSEEIRAYLNFYGLLEPNIVVYELTHPMDNKMCIIYNANRDSKTIQIPEGEWKVYAKGKKAGTEILEVILGGAVNVEPISALILVR
ncbi:MAG: type I pullulanase [Herbinix sp.]|nr:type I pullulanase [Herbinix sp.]